MMMMMIDVNASGQPLLRNRLFKKKKFDEHRQFSSCSVLKVMQKTETETRNGET